MVESATPGSHSPDNLHTPRAPCGGNKRPQNLYTTWTNSFSPLPVIGFVIFQPHHPQAIIVNCYRPRPARYLNHRVQKSNTCCIVLGLDRYTKPHTQETSSANCENLKMHSHIFFVIACIYPMYMVWPLCSARERPPPSAISIPVRSRLAHQFIPLPSRRSSGKPVG